MTGSLLTSKFGQKSVSGNLLYVCLHYCNWRMAGTFKMKKIIYQENFIEALSGVHACVFCSFILCDIKQHLLRRHKDEKEVMEALTSPVPTAFEELILWGDHRHNVKVLQKKQGVLFVLEGYVKSMRSKNAKSPVDYMPCPDCLVYVFYAEFLSHRHRFCLIKKKGKGPSRWAIENKIDIRRQNLRHLAILMLSDVLTVLPKSDGLIAEYEGSITAAERRRKPTQGRSETENLTELSSYCRVLDSKALRDSFSPSTFAIIFKIIKCLSGPLMPQLWQMAVSSLIRGLKSCASHLKDKVKPEMDNISLLHRVEKYLSLFDPMSRNISVRAFYPQTSVPVQPSSTTELKEILPVTSDILKLEDVFNSEMQKQFTKVTSNADISAYASLLEVTAAKILLLNKPRAKEVITLTVLSYKFTSGKLDPINEIVDNLSSVEKKLCDRLFVVPTPNPDGVMVPILFTPKLKTTLDLLLETRSQRGIHLSSPYVFAKSDNENLEVHEVLQRVTLRAKLDNPYFFVKLRMHKYIATACQIIAMEDSELNWLKSQMVDFTGDSYTIQTSAMEMAKVVKHFCEMDDEKMDSNVNKTLESKLPAVPPSSTTNADRQEGEPSDLQKSLAVPPSSTTNADRQEGEHSDLQNGVDGKAGTSSYRTHRKGYGPRQKNHRVIWRTHIISRKGTGTDQGTVIEVLSGMHVCAFCDSMVFDMTEHLLQVHRHEREVLEALQLPSTLQAFIRQADHRHNVKVLQRQHGTLLVLKFCTNTKSIEDYMPCPDCLAYVFYAEFLSHRQDCKVLTEKGSECDKKKADLDEVPQSKRVKRTPSTVEVSNIVKSVKSNALRNFVILMLSDAVAMLPKSSRRITLYEETMIAAEKRPENTQVRREVDDILRLVGHLKESYSTYLKESLEPAKFYMVFKLINWLKEYSRQGDTLQSGIYLKQILVLELGHWLKAFASQMKDKVGTGEVKSALLCRVEKYLSLFDAMVNDISVCQQVVAPSVKGEVNMHKTPEFREILLLTNDVLQLEKYLNLKVHEVLLKLRSNPTICKYISLLEVTAAKLVLFNKPRAKEVVMMTVASYKDSADKLNPHQDILGCLSRTERKLGERLVVVQVPSKEAVLVPILITPPVKTALDLLLKTRSLLNIHPMNPYLFAKDDDEYVNVREVLYASAAYARLQNPQLFMSMYMDKYIATICQICAMDGSELSWLKSHIEHPAIFWDDVHNIKSSSFSMATVAKLVCKDWKEPPESHMTDASSSIVHESIPQSVNTSDVRSTVSTVDAVEQQEEDDTVIRITVDEMEEQEDDKSVVKMSVDIPNMTEDAVELPEEKYSEVLRRENLPTMTGHESELPEEKYSEVLRREDTPITSEYTEEQREEKYSDVLRQNNLIDTVEDAEELPEEKYLDVLKRENINKIVEDEEDLPEEKYSDVLKRGGGAFPP